jgi:TonB-dependent SusC/RagA subfamily outer membrane receptor
MRISALGASRRTSLPVILLAGVLVGSVAACARSVDTAQTEPEPEPDAEPTTTTLADLTQREIERRNFEKLEDMLETRSPGISVRVNEDGTLSIRMGGPGSFHGSNAPLIVVDGPPYPSPRGRVCCLNPHDIESIEVLKYPPETSLYGVRGANGVILITTLRPPMK